MPAPRLTTSDYFLTPEVVAPQELVWGMVREAAAPTPRHQWAVGEFFFWLRLHVREQRLGQVLMAPLDVVLDGPRALVVQPDVVVVLQERRHIVTDRVWGAPDIALEVMSPRPRIGTLDERLDWFARYGVRECWLVHQPQRECEIVGFAGGRVVSRRVFGGGDPLESAVLPGFRMAVADVLAEG
jgi:Uma2 family endonuclease